VDPVCLNRSERPFSVPPAADRPTEAGRRVDSIVFGLAAVKNVGEGAVEALLEARKQAGGRFQSAIEVFERVNPQKVNRRVWESLIKAGAFDFAGEGRAALLAGLEAAMAEGARRQQDRLAGQTSLFQMFRPAAGAPKSAFRFPDVTQPLSVQLAMEREVLGLYLSGHPMQAHRKDADRLRLPNLASLAQVRPGEDGDEEIRLLVLPVETRVVKTRRGDKMAFVQLEDETGTVEGVFFADAWLRSQRAIEAGGAVLVTGTLEVGEEAIKLRANSAESLADLRARSTREVRIRLRWEELLGDRLDRLQTALVEGKGSCRAVLWLELQDGWIAEVELPEHPLDPSPELEERLVTLFGRGDALELR
jgi:DNA polymerase-3 subunit alpha